MNKITLAAFLTTTVIGQETHSHHVLIQRERAAITNVAEGADPGGSKLRLGVHPDDEGILHGFTIITCC